MSSSDTSSARTASRLSDFPPTFGAEGRYYGAATKQARTWTTPSGFFALIAVTFEPFLSRDSTPLGIDCLVNVQGETFWSHHRDTRSLVEDWKVPVWNVPLKPRSGRIYLRIQGMVYDIEYLYIIGRKKKLETTQKQNDLYEVHVPPCAFVTLASLSLLLI